MNDHCKAYPQNATLHKFDSLQKSVNFSVKMINSDEELVIPPIKKERKERAPKAESSTKSGKKSAPKSSDDSATERPAKRRRTVEVSDSVSESAEA